MEHKTKTKIAKRLPVDRVILRPTIKWGSLNGCDEIFDIAFT